MENLNLVKGKAYLVKHYGGKKRVRRIYKGEEMRFDSIKCFVFSSKVSKDLTVTHRETEDTESFTFHLNGTAKAPNQEVSIPYYDLLEVKDAN